MRSPYGMEIVESCLTCKMRADHIFCDLPPAALQSFENIKYAMSYPKGAVLFVEGQEPRGIFVLCNGSVKLSLSATNGKTIIVRLAEAGEALGLGATVSGKPYEMTAETIDPCQVTFVKRDDFLEFLKDDVEACFKVAEQLSEKYYDACKEVRSLELSHSAVEKLAKLLLEWSSKNGAACAMSQTTTSLGPQPMETMTACGTGCLPSRMESSNPDHIQKVRSRDQDHNSE